MCINNQKIDCMRNLLILILSVFLLPGCSESESDSPYFEITNVSISGDDRNYAGNLRNLPALSVNDEIEFTIQLNGNGNYLRSFAVKPNSDNLTTLLASPEDDISEEFSNLSEGVLGYKDVVETWVSVVAKVTEVSEEGFVLFFHLSSKARKCNPAIWEIELKVAEPE